MRKEIKNYSNNIKKRPSFVYPKTYYILLLEDVKTVKVKIISKYEHKKKKFYIS